jgi:hypothetical protein
VAKTITIYLSTGDIPIKTVIAELKAAKHGGNPYIGRSESEIAKMLLIKEVTRAQKRYCQKSKRAKN